VRNIRLLFVSFAVSILTACGSTVGGSEGHEQDSAVVDTTPADTGNVTDSSESDSDAVLPPPTPPSLRVSCHPYDGSYTPGSGPFQTLVLTFITRGSVSITDVRFYMRHLEPNARFGDGARMYIREFNLASLNASGVETDSSYPGLWSETGSTANVSLHNEAGLPPTQMLRIAVNAPFDAPDLFGRYEMTLNEIVARDTVTGATVEASLDSSCSSPGAFTIAHPRCIEPYTGLDGRAVCTPGCVYHSEEVLGCRPNAYARACDESGHFIEAAMLAPGCSCDEGCGPETHPRAADLWAEAVNVVWTISTGVRFAALEWTAGIGLNGIGDNFRDNTPDLLSYRDSGYFASLDGSDRPVATSSGTGWTDGLSGNSTYSFAFYRRPGLAIGIDVIKGYLCGGIHCLQSVCSFDPAGHPELGSVTLVRLVSDAYGAMSPSPIGFTRMAWPMNSHYDCFFRVP